ASPRNSSRSFGGRPPFSYAYERWVSESRSSSGSSVTPSASSNGAGSAGGPPGVLPPMSATRSGGLDDLAAVVLAARRARDVLELRLLAGAVGAGHQLNRSRLPLAAAGARVGSRHLPLRDGHE